MSIIIKASRWATWLHSRTGAVRKYTHERYIEHPRRVSEMIAEVTDDPNQRAAGWLHDTVEDTDMTNIMLEWLFNAQVALYVMEVTFIPNYAHNRKTRKAEELEFLKVASDEAKTIKLADTLDNVPSVILNDPKFAKVYVKEKLAQLPILRVGGNPILYDRLAGVIDSYYTN